MRRLLLLLFINSIISTNSEAKDLCQEYANYTPLPEWFSQLCTAGGNLKSKIGGAYSTFGDAFNLNPASIPTSKIPLGAEYIGSVSSTGYKSSFALIKGFGFAGTALTTNSDETFYGNSVFQAPNATTTSTSGYNTLTGGSKLPTINLGAALSFDEFFKGKKKSNLIPLTFGGTFKYNKLSNTWVPGFGFGTSIWKFSLGLSFTEDPATSTTAKVSYQTYTIGFKTSGVQIEYVYIRSSSVPTTVLVSQVGNVYTYRIDTRSVKPAAIITVSSNVAGFLLSAAVRQYQDINFETRSQYHLAVERLITPRVSLAFLSNYVVGYQSLGLQVLL